MKTLFTEIERGDMKTIFTESERQALYVAKLKIEIKPPEEGGFGDRRVWLSPKGVAKTTRDVHINGKIQGWLDKEYGEWWATIQGVRQPIRITSLRSLRKAVEEIRKGIEAHLIAGRRF